jgi:thiol:disulfide interchange protein
MALRAFLVLLGALAITAPQPAAAGTEELEWAEWSTGVFARAKAENRFVLLDLGAVWCHWCHVMEETTYRDPAVVRLIRSRYLPVRVDQDANPELSNRYEDYGWPATIVFAPDGSELSPRTNTSSPPGGTPAERRHGGAPSGCPVVHVGAPFVSAQNRAPSGLTRCAYIRP